MESVIRLAHDVMRGPVVDVRPDARVRTVLDLARRKGVHHFPVTREGALLGLVCTCDLEDAPAEIDVYALARREVITVQQGARLEEVARLMIDNAVGSVVVLKGDHVYGIITREDLINSEPRWAEQLADQLCRSCGEVKHLRPWKDGSLLCTSCLARAKGGRQWLDDGDGD